MTTWHTCDVHIIRCFICSIHFVLLFHYILDILPLFMPHRIHLIVLVSDLNNKKNIENLVFFTGQIFKMSWP